ncbi:MAG: ribosome-associated translation inhibitor RaiA [Anaerolineales bacterium]
MAQKMEIVGHDFEVSDRIHDYVTKKVSKLERYLSTVDEMRVELSHVKSARSATDRYVAELTVRGKGLLLRSEERADDIRTALDASIEKMQRQMARFKGKRTHGRGDGKSAAEVAPDPEIIEMMEAIAKEEPPVIVRRKRFDLIPMDETEAVEQMKLLGHENFFIFFNVKTEKINVVYQRRDGTYGLIEPHIR